MGDLPGAIIIGAQRSGTTRFYNLLTRHPDIAAAARKEVHFYDLRFHRGITWYKTMFPDLGGRVGVEASPYYIFHPLVADRIRETQPNVKLIALLRNPVDRAYSHFHHEVRAGHENQPFEYAIGAEFQRTEGAETRIVLGNGDFDTDHNWYSYQQRGMYARQLKRFHGFDTLLIRSEDFYEDESSILSEAHEFLGLESWSPGNYGSFKNKKQYPRMSVDTRKRLVDFFRPYNEELRELTGRDFDWDR